LSGIMLASTPEAQAKALEAANKGWDKPPTPPATPTRTQRSQVEPSFDSSPSFGGFDMPAPQVVTGFGGKPAPTPAPQPEI